MNRADLQRLTRTRVADARALLDAGQYSGAYYLCGYAVECAIKACIAKHTARYDFPEKEKVNASWTHKINALIIAAGLNADLERDARADTRFAGNWRTATDWSERSRYEVHTELEARDLYKAVTDRRHGVLRWLRNYW